MVAYKRFDLSSFALKRTKEEQFDSYFENSRNLYSQGNSYYYTLRGEKGALQATNQRDKNIKRINVLDELIAAMDDIDEGYERIIKSIQRRFNDCLKPEKIN